TGWSTRSAGRQPGSRARASPGRQSAVRVRPGSVDGTRRRERETSGGIGGIVSWVGRFRVSRACETRNGQRVEVVACQPFVDEVGGGHGGETRLKGSVTKGEGRTRGW